VKRHLLQQGPVIRSLLQTGFASGPRGTESPAVPGPLLQQTVPPRPDRLVDDYLRWAGGPRDRTLLPAHLFSQWGFPLLTRSLQGVPYDLRRALNGGCRIEVHEPLRRGEKLLLEAQLEDVDDDGYRAILTNRLTTRTPRGGHVEARMRVFVPLKKKPRTGPPKPKPRVPDAARPLAERRMRPTDAQRFVYLTGDVNPVHWSPLYARAAGFPSTILHGFATLAWAWEALVSARFAGDRSVLRAVDVRFVKPVVLPATVRLFDHGPDLAVGTAPGGPAYLVGTLETR
jgi:hypothetical protein